MKDLIRITHRPSGTVLAEGHKGWHMMPLEGNWYIHPSCLRTDAFKTTAVPGLCFYKGLYMWFDLRLRGASRMLAWRYVLPYPWSFFLWGRIGLPGAHPELSIEILPTVGTGVQPLEQGLSHDRERGDA